MITDLFDGPDQLFGLSARVVVIDYRPARSKVHPGRRNTGNSGKFSLDRAYARITGHTIQFHFERAARHTLMMHPGGRPIPWREEGTRSHFRSGILFGPVPRQVLLLLLLAGVASAHDARQGNRDQVFASVPFDDWLNHSEQSHLRWTTSISEPTLSAHQRMSARLFAEIDGRELAKRRGQGKMLVLVQIDDEQRHVWQNHQEMDLEPVEEGIKANDALFSQLFFALPGDYRVNIAIYDTATQEHAISKRRLHVPNLKNDPFPDAWRDLPAIEFVGPATPPDQWYLPMIQSRLNLKVEAHEPVQIDLLVNLTPSERLNGSARVQNRNLSALLPATRIFTQIDWGKSPLSIELLDISRRKVTYRQEDAHGIDWAGASAGLSDVKPGIIDVNSLQNRWYMAQFFLDEVSRQIARTKRQKALIILSSAVEFEGGQDFRPLNADVTGSTTVFYVRYQPLFYPARPGREMGRGGFTPHAPLPPVDQLAALLKPLDPHLYDVTTPEQFRKVLATILGEIGKM